MDGQRATRTARQVAGGTRICRREGHGPGPLPAVQHAGPRGDGRESAAATGRPAGPAHVSHPRADHSAPAYREFVVQLASGEGGENIVAEALAAGELRVVEVD